MKRYFLLVLLLTACATQKPITWNKPGASTQDFNMDAGQCRAQAYGVAGAPPMQVAMVYGSCMQGKGWTATEG